MYTYQTNNKQYCFIAKLILLYVIYESSIFLYTDVYVYVCEYEYEDRCRNILQASIKGCKA